MSSDASVLFDAPGPRTRRNQRIVAGVLLLVAIGIGVWILMQFAAKGQLDAAKWRPLLWTDVWSEYLLPGILGTLRAAAISIAAAGVIGLLLGVGRLSSVRPVRWLCGAVVEVFRAIPVLVMMLGSYALFVNRGMFPGYESLAGVVTGLTFYNGAVIAELIRSGVNNLPKELSDRLMRKPASDPFAELDGTPADELLEIGRASCRERV